MFWFFDGGSEGMTAWTGEMPLCCGIASLTSTFNLFCNSTCYFAEWSCKVSGPNSFASFM